MARLNQYAVSRRASKYLLFLQARICHVFASGIKEGAMARQTQIGIIEAGRPSDAVLETYGDFPKMFAAYFKAAEQFSYKVYPVAEQNPFPEATACQAWIITGSPAGVYEDHPWLPPLMDFIRTVISAKVPMLGICFGHQVMAQAMGGRVEKSPSGWGLGLHEYVLTETGQKIFPQRLKLRLPASHQDQVVVPPPQSTVLAYSEFCPYAALAYGETALSLQPHPEFTDDCIKLSIAYRREKALVPERAAADGLASFTHFRSDAEALESVLERFLGQAA